MPMSSHFQSYHKAIESLLATNREDAGIPPYFDKTAEALSTWGMWVDTVKNGLTSTHYGAACLITCQLRGESIPWLEFHKSTDYAGNVEKRVSEFLAMAFELDKKIINSELSGDEVCEFEQEQEFLGTEADELAGYLWTIVRLFDELSKPVDEPDRVRGSVAVELSAPMSLAEMSRRITGNSKARAREVRPLLERYGLQRVSESVNKWTVRLDEMDASTRRKLEQEK